MSHDEQYLNQKFGKAQPFRVPEGYFSNFADSLMQQLSEYEIRDTRYEVRDDHSPRTLHLAPRTYRWIAAACLATLFVVGAGILGFHSTSNDATLSAAAMQQTSSSSAAIDAAADYVMIDNGDIYAFVSDY